MSDHPHNTTFLSTLSLRRATLSYFYIIKVTGISIHALLAESDPWGAAPPSPTQGYFYPRSPCGERRCRQRAGKYRADFYPRSPCGERLDGSKSSIEEVSISIHALLAESDTIFWRIHQEQHNISIHALLAESDTQGVFNLFANPGFLSTLSLRRATPGPQPRQ